MPGGSAAFSAAATISAPARCVSPRHPFKPQSGKSRHANAIFGGRHFEPGFDAGALVARRDFLENARRGRKRSLVGDQEHALHTLRRTPLIPARIAVIASVGRRDLDALAGNRMYRPARCRAVFSMQHEVDVDLVPAQCADRIGAARRARICRHRPMDGQPCVVQRQ